MQQAIDRLTDMLAYPADDPRATMLLMLAFVALGLLIAVVLLAVASPRRKAPETIEPEGVPVDEDLE